MAAQSYADPIQQQDSLRSIRNFVSLMSGAMGDQTFAETDGIVINPPGQFGVQGPTGVAIEGRPVVVGAVPQGTQAAPMLPPGFLLLGAVVVGYLLLK